MPSVPKLVFCFAILGVYSIVPGASRAEESTQETGAARSPKEQQVDEWTSIRIRNVELEKELTSLREMVGMYRNFVGELGKCYKENAELRIKNAELQVKLDVTEALSTAKVEKAESDSKLAIAQERLRAAHRFPAVAAVPESQPVAGLATSELVEAVRNIQEDLANIRRQIPHLRRGSAPMEVGSNAPSPVDYVPIGACLPGTNFAVDPTGEKLNYVPIGSKRPEPECGSESPETTSCDLNLPSLPAAAETAQGPIIDHRK